MANEKKPSIYYDRSTIGSQDELDEYGVWVKSEPQDLSATGSASAAGSSGGLAGSGMDELPDLDSFEFSSGSGDSASDDISFDSFDDGASDDGTSDEDAISESSGLEDDFELPEFDDDAAQSFDSASEDDSLSDISMDDFTASQGENSQGLVEELTEEEGLDDGELNLDIDFNELEDTAAGDLAEDVEFDDIAAVGEDLQGALPESGIQGASQAQGADLSTQLLMKIASELSSIKDELSGLKAELAAHTAEEGSGPKKAAKDDAKGFFDEEEDEKIALTGDELNNILNTADFTEEAGQDATDGETEELELDGDFATEDVTPDFLDSQDLAGGGESPEAEEGEGLALRDDEILPEEDFSGIAEEEELTLDEGLLDIKEDEALKELRESGATPITQAPDDTSYLEAAEEAIDDTVSLDDSLLEEPGLDEMTGLDETLDDSLIEEPLLEEPSLVETLLDETASLNDSLLGEPELGDVLDNTAEEPDLGEIGIDLEEEAPAAEALSEEPGDDLESEEELELDLSSDLEEEAHALEETGEESLVTELPDDFVVEADESQNIPGAQEDLLSEDILPEDFSEDLPGEIEEADGLLSAASAAQEGEDGLPPNLQAELKTVLSYMDQLLESLPEEKIEEFAKSEYYETYKKLFEELGLV
jgi:hypothetical protein